MVQQTSEERMGWNRESTLMEGCEGDDVAIGRRRRILTAGHKPLCRIGPPTEKPRLTRPSMQAWVTSEQYHESMEDGGGCGEAKVVVEKRKL